jgi:outer membrane protein
VFNRLTMILPLALMATMAAAAQTAPPQSKVGIIHIQNAIISTKEGQKAATELQQRYEPKKKEIDEKDKELAALQDQLKRGANTMSEDAKASLTLEIEQKTKSRNRLVEDVQTDFDQDQNRILQKLGQRMMVVIDKYARDNGYVLILDVSSPQTPVLYASNGINITDEIVTLYDKNAGEATPAASKPAATPPSKPAPAAPKK